MTNAQDILFLRKLLVFMQPLFGALILMCFYFWLRRRQAKDTSLIWLSVCLLSWSIVGLMQLILGQGQFQPWIFFVLSPGSNILFTMTAFRLLRVREVIQRRSFQGWQKIATGAVVMASLIALTLELCGVEPLSTVGRNIDAVVSIIALIMLGLSLSYSFYKYGNQPLIGLTLLNFIYFVWYQFDFFVTQKGRPTTNVFLTAIDITSVSSLTMLFIALTLAWGLSNTSRLKFRDSEPVNITAMFIDLRGSTAWEREISKEGDSEYVVTFKNKFNEWVLRCASEAPHDTPHAKFTGDGFMLIWENPDESMIIDRANAVVGLGCALCSGYPLWIKSTPELWKDVPRFIGVGVDFGSAKRLTSENGSYDYEGSPVNFAAKMQGLARPHGVVIRDKWKLPNALRNKFTKKGTMVIGDECLPVRATKEVNLPTHGKIDPAGLEDMGLE